MLQQPPQMDLATYLKVTLEGRREAFLKDLADLVALDSPTTNKEAVDRAGQFMMQRLAALGSQVEVGPSATHGNVVVGALRGQGRCRILLIGHLDTVHPLGTAEARPFAIRDGRAYGPGTADMKAGVLAGLYAMEALLSLERKPFAELSLLLNGDEEVGSPSSAALIATHARRADAVLVLEAARSNGAVVSARKGTGTYYLSVRGRAAHAGASPELGRNAIVELCHKVLAVEGLNGMQPGVTLNVGVIQGGSVSNVVPADATVAIDVRVPDDKAAVAVDQALRNLTISANVVDTVTTVSGGFVHAPMPRRPGNRGIASPGAACRGGVGVHIT